MTFSYFIVVKINLVWLKNFWMQLYSFMAFRTKILMQIDWGYIIFLFCYFSSFFNLQQITWHFSKNLKKQEWSRFINIIELSIAKVKVEKTIKGSLDSIPSPSVKIQIIGGKDGLRSKSKTLLGIDNKLLKAKSLLTSPSNVLPLLPQVNFPSNDLNFH